MNDKMEGQEKIKKLLQIIADLRGEGGCPWDKKQTHESLARYLEEEAWEVKDAIFQGAKKEELKGELADVLLQVMMHSAIAKEENKFDFYDVLEHLIEKIIRRHPHVFDKENIADDFDIEKEWPKIKKKETGKDYHPLERIPHSASLEFFFQKLLSFPLKKEIDFSLIKEKLADLEKEKSERGEKLLGSILLELAHWSHQKKISWEKALRKQFLNRIKEIVKEDKKKLGE